MRRILKTLSLSLVVIALATLGRAQSPTNPSEGDDAPEPSSSSRPDAPAPRAAAPTYKSSGNDSYLIHIGALCGTGVSNSAVSAKPTVGCGAGMTVLPFPLFVEFGVMGPQANRSYLSGYISVDGSVPLAPISHKYLPMAIVGYSRLFETGHSVDYGLALAMPRFGKVKDETKSLRIELRDYWTFANPTQHNVMVRVGWMAIETD